MIRIEQFVLLKRYIPAVIVIVAIGAVAVVERPSRVAAQSAGLMAAYSFNEGSGTTVADVSGHNLTGTIAGATWKSPFGRVQRVGAMLTLFMRAEPVLDFAAASASDTDRYGALFRHLLERGIYLAPSQFEAMFVSTAHTEEDVDRTVTAVADFVD